MNAKLLKVVFEGIVMSALSVALTFLSRATIDGQLNLALLPLLLFAFRQGTVFAVGAGVLTGIIHWLFFGMTMDVSVALLLYFLPYVLVGIAGFFARNVVRTAFNRRLGATTLNLVTGTLLVGVGSWLLQSLALSLSQKTAWMTALSTTWVYSLGWTVALALFFSVLVRVVPDLYVPKKTRFLSRREQSHLLND